MGLALGSTGPQALQVRDTLYDIYEIHVHHERLDQDNDIDINELDTIHHVQIYHTSRSWDHQITDHRCTHLSLVSYVAETSYAWSVALTRSESTPMWLERWSLYTLVD